MAGVVVFCRLGREAWKPARCEGFVTAKTGPRHFSVPHTFRLRIAHLSCLNEPQGQPVKGFVRAQELLRESSYLSSLPARQRLSQYEAVVYGAGFRRHHSMVSRHQRGVDAMHRSVDSLHFLNERCTSAGSQLSGNRTGFRRQTRGRGQRDDDRNGCFMDSHSSFSSRGGEQADCQNLPMEKHYRSLVCREPGATVGASRTREEVSRESDR